MAEPEQLELDDVLNDPPPVEKPTSVRDQHKAKEMEAQGKDIDGQPKPEPKVEKVEPKVEPKVEAKVEVKDDSARKYNAAVAQANAERTKRQDAERRLQELMDSKAKEAEKPFWEDPDNRIKTFEEKMTQREKEIEARQQEREVAMVLKTSEMLSRREHPDFDEKVEHFGEMLKNIPGLYQQWLNSTDPGEFAYKTAKGDKDLQEAGNIDKLREKIEKETRVKLEAELKEKAEKLAKEREDLPGTLSDARGTPQNRVVWGGPPPLDDILK